MSATAIPPIISIFLFCLIRILNANVKDQERMVGRDEKCGHQYKPEREREVTSLSEEFFIYLFFI